MCGWARPKTAPEYEGVVGRSSLATSRSRENAHENEPRGTTDGVRLGSRPRRRVGTRARHRSVWRHSGQPRSFFVVAKAKKPGDALTPRGGSSGPPGEKQRSKARKNRKRRDA